MHDKTEEVLAYLCKRLGSTTFERIIRTLFLIDWTSAFLYGEQVTPASWTYTKHGPISNEVLNAINTSKRIQWRVPPADNEIILSLRDANENIELRGRDVSVIEHTLSQSSGINDAELNSMVSGTYPVLATNMNEGMDLVQIAEQYRKTLIEIGSKPG